MSWVFESARLRARELSRDEMPLLQALFDDNPEYFRAVNHRAALPDEAWLEFDELPPPHLSFERRWFTGLFEITSGKLAGAAILLADFMRPGIWHLSLFLVATRLHGSGAAGEIYRALESWAKASGAEWLRLGVVLGNARAEAFWQRHGYVELRTREVDTGGRMNVVRVMLKPLAGGSASQYLERIERDRPGSQIA